jgi:hypothetical protein
MRPPQPYWPQLDTHAIISSAAVSPTGAYLAFGDQSGIINILTAVEEDSEQTPFNGFAEGQPINWADPAEELPDIDWTDSTWVHPQIFNIREV